MESFKPYHFFWGHLQARTHRPLELFSHYAKVGKKVQPLRFLIKRSFLVNDPDCIHSVLTEGSENFVRGFGYKQMIPFMGSGLITSDGDFWLKQRRSMHSAFSGKRHEDWLKVINTQADLLIEKWLSEGPDKEINFSQDITRMTIQVICRTMFGFDPSYVEDRTMAALDIITDEVYFRVLRVWPRLTPKKESRFKSAIAEIRKIAMEILQNGEAHEGTLLKILKDKMSPEQATDEIVTMFLAGFESSSSTLAWTLVLLEQNPEIKKELYDVVKEIRPGSYLNLEALQGLPFVRACIQETMRLYPAIWVLARENPQSEIIGDLKIPAGSIIQICPYSLHRDPSLWPEPQKFVPSRFIQLPVEKRQKGSYIPFGAGPHVCIGAQLAMMELQVGLCKIMGILDIQLLSSAILPEARITLRPQTAVKGFVKRRGQ